MWQVIEISVDQATHRGRYRTEGRRLVLEWRGGRAFAWCGALRPDVVAALRLRRLVRHDPPGVYAAIQLSKPALRPASSRLRPMKTIRE